jgi:hypothetical protein
MVNLKIQREQKRKKKKTDPTDTRRTFGLMGAVGRVHSGRLVLGRATTGDQDGLIGMRLDVLLQILRTLEGLAAKVALVRLEWHMNAYVRRDVVSLDSSGPALVPPADEVQIVGALAPNMLLADVLLDREVS